MATSAMELNLFVRKQLKMCECLSYADLFKDYTEEMFRNLTCSALNKLPLVDDDKDKIIERVSQLKLEAALNSQLSSLTSSIPIKADPQIKQEGTKHEELYTLNEDDDEVEFICVKSQDHNSSQMEVGAESPGSSNLQVSNTQNNYPDEEIEYVCNIDASTSKEPGSSIKKKVGSPNNSQAKTPRTADGSQKCCRKRKIQGETFHEGNCTKMPRTARQSFWKKFARFISNESNNWNFKMMAETLRFKDDNWISADLKDVKSVHAFTRMTKATINSSCFKKQIKIQSLFRNLKMPDLRSRADQCGLKNSCSIELKEILNFIFNVASNLKEITLEFEKIGDLELFLGNLNGIPKKNLIRLELKSNSIAITQTDLQKVADLAQNYFLGIRTLKLDCKIHVEDNSDQSLNLLLYRLADSLKELKVTKAFIGLASRINVFEINVPEMRKLNRFDLASKYEIRTSEIKEPEIVDLEEGASTFQEKLIEIPVLMNFTGQKYEELLCLRLGSKFEIKLNLDNFPEFEIFVVGSAWNLRDIFGNGSQQYKLKYIQFPDALTDPTIFQRVKTFCPELTRVKLQLPTVRCLQEFFNVFANTKIERLSLTFDYVFEAALICPLTGIPFKLSSGKDLSKVAKLKKCSDWEGFCKMKGIDIPKEAEAEGQIIGQQYFGLSKLTFLEHLKLRYHSRELKYPKENGNGYFWSERNGFLSFDKFPFGKEIHDELTKAVLGGLGHLRTPNTLRDPKAREEFYKKTGWVRKSSSSSSGSKTKTRPNEISSAALIARKTEVKHENNG